MEDVRLNQIAALLRPVPNFPKEGILFWDIAPLLRDDQVFAHTIDLMADYWWPHDIEAIAGFDARGFIFGTALAQRLNLPFEQIRKKGKLPGTTVSESYALEYGEAEVEMIDDGFIAGKRVLLVDDLLATGGTAAAGAKLVEKIGGTVAGFACITELPELGGRAALQQYPIQSLLTIIKGQVHTGVEYCVDLFAFDQLTHDLLLIERQCDPEGLAMPGGRIEHEGLLQAGMRELEEETGCTFEPGFSFFHTTLTEPDRDPRGVKVSYVLLVFVDARNLHNEVGKTVVRRYPQSNGLPDRSQFVLGHGRAVHLVSDVLQMVGRKV